MIQFVHKIMHLTISYAQVTLLAFWRNAFRLGTLVLSHALAIRSCTWEMVIVSSRHIKVHYYIWNFDSTIITDLSEAFTFFTLSIFCLAILKWIHVFVLSESSATITLHNTLLDHYSAQYLIRSLLWASILLQLYIYSTN